MPDRATATRSASLRLPLDPMILLDGHSLTFKAYYAIRRLTAPDGSPVGMVYGFLRMLLRLIRENPGAGLAVVFDTGKPTFRSELYPEYKANRESPPPDFGDQMGHIYRLLSAMDLAVYDMAGFEADDLIATMAAQIEAGGGKVMVVSADKDLFQLVTPSVRMIRFEGDQMKAYGAPEVLKKMGVPPERIPDYLALVGDSSDNIPGVPSIGPKTAVKLLEEFGGLDDLIARSGEITNKRQRGLIEEHAEQARLSRTLATVSREVDLKWQPEDCAVPADLWSEEAVAIMRELGFTSILKEFGIEAQAPGAVAAANEASDYRIMTDEAALRKWVAEAALAQWLALDTETTSTDPMRGELTGISMAFRPGAAIYIPVGHRLGELVDEQIPLSRLREILNLLLSGGKGTARGPKLTAHNAKYDWKILERHGFHPADPAFDSMVASFVLDPGRASGHGLKTLSQELLGLAMTPITEILGTGRNALTMDQIPIEDASDYAALDADATLRLTTHLDAELDRTPTLRKLFDEMELPLIPVLHRMESGGFAVDPDQLRRLSQVMAKEADRLQKAVWEQAGHEFNIASPKQVQEVLFGEMGLPPGKKTKTGYSTDNDVMEGLASSHPIAELILEYRGVTKLKSTYADALPQEINPATHRIHSSFNQTIAQTGRLSSNNPNLQNIPVRTDLGREIRRTFIPDAPDHRLLAADYSQIELRILAHFSRDAALLAAYRDNRDIHSETAARIFGVDEADVTSDMRAKAKVVNFGIIYGMSAHGLSQRLRIPRGEAASIIDAYFAGYPGVRAWIDATLEGVRERGYAETLMGRRRALPEINAKNGMLRANAERIAINTPIQGTSADMIKLAMIRIDRAIGGVTSTGRMLCQVHDELIFSEREDAVGPLTDFVRGEMIAALELDVPVVVDVAVGRNWAEC